MEKFFFYSSLISIVIIKIMTQNKFWGNLCLFSSQITCHHQRKSEPEFKEEPEAGTEPEPMEDH